MGLCWILAFWSALRKSHKRRHLRGYERAPCPCGFASDPRRMCRCQPIAVERYAGRVSGPLRDRIDLQITLTPVSSASLTGAGQLDMSWSTERKRVEVEKAQAIQLDRAGALNAHLDTRTLRRTLQLTRDAERTLRFAAEAELLTGRGIHRVQRLARTIADVEGVERVSEAHVALAVHLRAGEPAPDGASV